jgi:hypothetical protein
MEKWKKLPQRKKHTEHYFFDAELNVIDEVRAEIPANVIDALHNYIKAFAIMQNGEIYPEQVFTNGKRKLVITTQISQEMVMSGRFKFKDNRCDMFWEDW